MIWRAWDKLLLLKQAARDRCFHSWSKTGLAVTSSEFATIMMWSCDKCGMEVLVEA